MQNCIPPPPLSCQSFIHYLSVTDSFTDTAISKFNGQVTEKELQPWEADGPNEESLESLEADGSAATAPQVRSVYPHGNQLLTDLGVVL